MGQLWRRFRQTTLERGVSHPCFKPPPRCFAITKWTTSSNSTGADKMRSRELVLLKFPQKMKAGNPVLVSSHSLFICSDWFKNFEHFLWPAVSWWLCVSWSEKLSAQRNSQHSPEEKKLFVNESFSCWDFGAMVPHMGVGGLELLQGNAKDVIWTVWCVNAVSRWCTYFRFVCSGWWPLVLLVVVVARE